MSATPTGSPPAQPHLRVIFAVLSLGVLSFSLLQSLVLPVLPLLRVDLHTTENNVTWVLTAYLLAASVATPILGRVGDLIGKRPVLVGVLVALALGSVLAALATSMPVMIVARVLQGVGGGVVPLTFGIIRDLFPRERVAGLVGTVAAMLAVGGGLGLVVAGPLVNALSYHWLFWLPGFFVAVAAVATYLVIPTLPSTGRGGIAWFPAVLLSGWLITLLLAMSEAPAWGWGSPTIIGLFVASAALIVGWVYSETRAKAPLIDMRMMRIPAVWTNNLVSLLFGVGMYSVMTFLPGFLQAPRSLGYGFGSSLTETGMIMLPMTFTMFAFGTWSGPLSKWFGARAVVVVGTAVLVPGYFLLAYAHGHIWELLVTTALIGAGMGLGYSAMSSIVVDAVPPEQTGIASGMNANIRTIGGAIGAAIGTSIVTAGSVAGQLPKESGYTNCFAMLAFASVLATGAALAIPSRRRAAVARTPAQEEQAAMSHGEMAIVAAGTVVGDLPE